LIFPLNVILTNSKKCSHHVSQVSLIVTKGKEKQQNNERLIFYIYMREFLMDTKNKYVKHMTN